MEVNANRPRDRVNSQRRDLPLSVMVRIHLEVGRARVAKGAQVPGRWQGVSGAGVDLLGTEAGSRALGRS